MYEEYILPSLELIKNIEFRHFIEGLEKSDDIVIPIGKEGKSYYYESLQSMPNLLVGGTVASGKSSFVHAVLSTILLTKKPDETKLVILDSKKVEYKQYNGIAHLLMPIVSDEKKGTFALKKMCDEIKKRMEEVDRRNVKNIKQYNDSLTEGEIRYPDIVIMIDDFDSFCMYEGVDEEIEFISKYGWNVNIYLIITSNHPSSKIISTISKTNFPSRLCFSVPSKKDSMVVLDEPDAYNLREIGSALYKSRNISELKKVKTEYITEDEIRLIIAHIFNEQKKLYRENGNLKEQENICNNTSDIEKYDDPLYDEVVEFVITSGKASASLLQRRFKLGYNRAARIVDLLEERGIIGPQNGSKPREVLCKINPLFEFDKNTTSDADNLNDEIEKQNSYVNMNENYNNIINNNPKRNALTNNQRLLLSFILIIIILSIIFLCL